jgi:hypothetical protein
LLIGSSVNSGCAIKMKSLGEKLCSVGICTLKGLYGNRRA